MAFFSEQPGRRAFWLPFLWAALVALAAGWFVYPRLAWVRVTQPIRFSHKIHARQDVECATCHFGKDMTHQGLPTLAVCASCHDAPTGGTGEDDKEIDKLVWDYVKKGRQVPWLSSLRLPSHVRFRHAPHKELACTACHQDMAATDSLDVTISRISGVSRQAMPMQACITCHNQTGAGAQCLTCHR